MKFHCRTYPPISIFMNGTRKIYAKYAATPIRNLTKSITIMNKTHSDCMFCMIDNISMSLIYSLSDRPILNELYSITAF